MLVTNYFSTRTSYENQTKKAITNKFVQEAMTEFFRSRLQVYFIENKHGGRTGLPIRCWSTREARETAEKARVNIKKSSPASIDVANRVQKFVDCRSRDASQRELYIVEGDSA